MVAIGIWTRQLEDHPAAKAQETARELEDLGYGALWFGEAAGREALTNAGMLLAGTRRIVIATGIANIYARDAVAMAAGQKTLAEAYPDRFLLGLGVSHVPLVEQLRGHRYEKPVATMRAYLDAMDQAPYRSVPPPTKPLRVLAALGPKMLELSRERADGAHPYNVNPEHTAQAREILGPEPLSVSRAGGGPGDRSGQGAARSDEHSLASISRCPTTPTTFCGSGLTKPISKMAEATVSSMQSLPGATWTRSGIEFAAHHSAGADHVCIQVLTADPKTLPLREWRELATALLRS